jgi:hypothetical protein
MVNVTDPKLPQPVPFPAPAPAQSTPQQSGGSFGNTYADRPVVPTVPPDKATRGDK